MKKHRRFLSFAAIASTGVLAISLLGFFLFNDKRKVTMIGGAEASYTLEISHDNGGPSATVASDSAAETSATTPDGNQIGFKYFDAYYEGSDNEASKGFMSIASDGMFYNTDFLTGITSFSVTYRFAGDSDTAYVYLNASNNNHLSTISLAGNKTFQSKSFSVANGYFPKGANIIALVGGESSNLMVKEFKITYSCVPTEAYLALHLATNKTTFNVGDSLLSSLSVRASYYYSGLQSVPFDATGANGYTLYFVNAADEGRNFDGTFTSGDVGIGLLTASYNGKESAETLDIKVIDPANPVKVTSVTISNTSLSLAPDQDFTLTASVLPATANDESIVFSSDDETVATVSQQGLVHTLKAGSCAILATSPDGPKASCSLTVTAAFARQATSLTCIDYDSSLAPSQGAQKALFVPVSLKGNTGYSWDEEKIAKVGDSASDFAAYYENASLGQLAVSADVGGTLTSMYEADYSQDDLNHDDDDSATSDDMVLNFTNLFSAIAGATTWLGENGYDLDSYDSNDDGYIDSIHFIFDGSDGGKWGQSALWPHMDYTHAAPGTKEAPTVNVYSSTNLGHFTDAITAIHEQGHIYGLQDYYNYNFDLDHSDYVGGADMQSSNVFDWNPFSKFSLGWVEPFALKSGESQATITLSSSALTGDCLLLASDYNGSAFDEYILLELFTKDGNNVADWNYWSQHYGNLGDGGVRLYHVDARMWGYNADIDAGGYVDAPSATYKNYQLASDNSSGDTYASPRPSPVSDDYHLLHLIQQEGVNTFGDTSSDARHCLQESDLFKTGDTFTLGAKPGYTDYGPSFFPNSDKFNNGDLFPYGISFDSVTSNSVTLTIKYFA